jgi:hypothetical protein
MVPIHGCTPHPLPFSSVVAQLGAVAPLHSFWTCVSRRKLRLLLLDVRERPLSEANGSQITSVDTPGFNRSGIRCSFHSIRQNK